MSESEKRDHFALMVDFEVVRHGTVDGLSVALFCTSIAAPVPEIRLLKVRKYAQCNCKKTARNLSIIILVNMAMCNYSSWLEAQERTRGFKLCQDVGTIPQVRMMQ